MNHRGMGVPAVALILVLGLGAGAAGAQATAVPDGADTPQAVVAAMQQATKANDWAGAFGLMLPAARPEMAQSLVQGVLMLVAIKDPDDPILKDASVPKAQADAKRKAYRDATATLKRALQPHGMAGLVGQAPLHPATQKQIETGLATANVPALMRDTMTALDRIAPALGIGDSDKPVLPPIGTVTGYAVKGDRATAREGKTTMDFARVGGRWYMAPPPAK